MGGGLSLLPSIVEGSTPLDCENCKHLFYEKWGGVFHCCDCGNEFTDEERVKEEESKINAIEDNSTPEDAVFRGVTIQFLVDFAKSTNCWNMTTREVRRLFVMAATRETHCRFVELEGMSAVTGRATTFVSHTWGSKFGDLVAALCGDADRTRVVWVDIFAVRQWPSLKPDLDFSAVVKQCQSLMIVCSSQSEIVNMKEEDIKAKNVFLLPPSVRSQIAFLRVWCLVEVHAAILNELPIVMQAGRLRMNGENIYFSEDWFMIHNLISLIDINAAEATVAEDRQRILGDIQAKGGIDAMNRKIRGVLYGCRNASQQHFVLQAACGDAFALKELQIFPSKYLANVAACGHVKLLRKLIDLGGNVDQRNQFKQSPQMNYSDMTALMYAAKAGHLACVELLIARGCEVNLQDASGMTALMHAAMKDQLDCVEVLVRCVDNINEKDKFGRTALSYASEEGHTDCVDLLFKSGAKIESPKEIDYDE